MARFLQKRSFFTIVRAWEKGVKLGFGKYVGTLDSGIRLNIPIYHTVYKVNMADRVQDLAKQSLISKDNVSFYIDSSVQYRVINAEKAILNITDLDTMLLERCQMVLRKVLSSLEINEILHDMEDTTRQIKEGMNDLEQKWGIEVASVQIKDIRFDESMRRAMAVKAEADRSAEAKIINARADVETAKLYAEASEVYKENPITLRLREFQLWNSISKNPNNTIYVVPSNIVDFLPKSKNPEK